MTAIFTQALVIGALCAGLGWLLSIASRRWSVQDSALIDAIEAELPQTQCGQCEYPGCRAYASAVAGGEAIDRCPPGGDATAEALARLLNRPRERDRHLRQPGINQIARIREADCVGCALCIPACPVDAIIGAQGFLHGVLEDLCTGCELCLKACPVDCIDMTETRREAPAPKTPPRVASAEPLGCIRCGQCDRVCPKGISVRELWWSIRQGASDAVPGPGPADCIACGLCDAICPSGISLAEPILQQAARNEARQASQAHASRASALFDLSEARRRRAQSELATRRAERLRRRASSTPP